MSGAGEDKRGRAVAAPASRAEIDAFLAAAGLPAERGRGRLIFALDATMSRRPTWDLAQDLQARMFRTAASHGGLVVQLVYYRGFRECRASRFMSGGEALADAMTRVRVAAGLTQIGRVLRHVLDEAKTAPAPVLVFVGDAMEERPDELADLAGRLGLLGVKAFMFQEGRDRAAEAAFRQIALLTGGAYATFDASAAERLAALLSAAAAYAAGGRAALELEARRGASAELLLAQLR
ncbi:VWA domain-containing protein [Methylocella sp.]|uniref:VWA domain-containing protein n=1 Tax=Methylocella sp. TaxID=1978226 RepID=UPI0035B22B1D